MRDKSVLQWPFFEAHHRALAEKLESWADANLAGIEGDVEFVQADIWWPWLVRRRDFFRTRYLQGGRRHSAAPK